MLNYKGPNKTRRDNNKTSSSSYNGYSKEENYDQRDKNKIENEEKNYDFSINHKIEGGGRGRGRGNNYRDFRRKDLKGKHRDENESIKQKLGRQKQRKKPIARPLTFLVEKPIISSPPPPPRPLPPSTNRNNKSYMSTNYNYNNKFLFTQPSIKFNSNLSSSSSVMYSINEEEEQQEIENKVNDEENEDIILERKKSQMMEYDYSRRRIEKFTESLKFRLMKNMELHSLKALFWFNMDISDYELLFEDPANPKVISFLKTKKEEYRNFYKNMKYFQRNVFYIRKNSIQPLAMDLMKQTNFINQPIYESNYYASVVADYFSHNDHFIPNEIKQKIIELCDITHEFKNKLDAIQSSAKRLQTAIQTNKKHDKTQVTPYEETIGSDNDECEEFSDELYSCPSCNKQISNKKYIIVSVCENCQNNYIREQRKMNAENF